MLNIQAEIIHGIRRRLVAQEYLLPFTRHSSPVCTLLFQRHERLFKKKQKQTQQQKTYTIQSLRSTYGALTS